MHDGSRELTELQRSMKSGTPIAKALKKNGNTEFLPLIFRVVSYMFTAAWQAGLTLVIPSLERLAVTMAQSLRQSDGRLLPPLYMAVSYNPAGAGGTEWVMLLDFLRSSKRRRDFWGNLRPL